MLAFLGLGNPGPQYNTHRHNIGAMVIDALVMHLQCGPPQNKHGCLLYGANQNGQKIILAKPQTFMNASGLAVQKLMQAYKLPAQDILVIHDEMALDLGVLRFKKNGGHAGHNGIRDIIAHIGNDFARLRIGIGHPGKRAHVTGHVLGNFDTAQKPVVDCIMDAFCVHHLLLWDGQHAALLQAIQADIRQALAQYHETLLN
ncbi:MAG: aminoacyl-tRNA hydrolase [Pseudomonadota bacterium]